MSVSVHTLDRCSRCEGEIVDEVVAALRLFLRDGDARHWDDMMDEDDLVQAQRALRKRARAALVRWDAWRAQL